MLMVIITSSCQYMLGKRIRGNGNIKTATHSMSGFKDIEVAGAIDLYVSQGEIVPVKVETDENLLPYIEVFLEGNKLVVRHKEGTCIRRY